MIGIWQDTYYKIEGTEDNDSLTFSIQTTDGTINENGVEIPNDIIIFNGKAWAKPIENSISINLNNYCKDYLKMDMPDLLSILIPTTYTHKNAVKEFTLLNDADVVLGKYKFIMDWSYEYLNYNNRPMALSNPINGKAVNGMMVFYTYLDSDDKVKSIISPSISGLNDMARKEVYKEVGTPCNARYALYYNNRYGGWDSFLIEGKTIKKDNYTNYFIEGDYNNNTIEFGKRVYHNVITTHYELHTGWLKDSESDNLAFNLLSSNMVYLHDLKEGTIKPVVITDADAIYKTFANQNNKLFNYTINVECSQKQHNL